MTIIKLKSILKVVSENPKILNVTSLQLVVFTCNCSNNSSLVIISDVLANPQTADLIEKTPLNPQVIK